MQNKPKIFGFFIMLIFCVNYILLVWKEEKILDKLRDELLLNTFFK